MGATLISGALVSRDEMAIIVDDTLCKGCNICVEYCPLDVFEVSTEINRRGYYVPVPVKEKECVDCRLCELLCPEFAITIRLE